MKYIFHIHTNYSSDCNMSLKSVYKKIIKNNIKGITITDHNTISGAVQFKKLYGKAIDVIIGEEIMTSQGEIIGLFLKEEIPKGMTPEETIKEIKRQRGIVYIPHPFDEKRKKTCLPKEIIEKNINDIDIIEVYNGRCISEGFNKKAADLCMRLNKTAICGCDAHLLSELKYNIVEVNKLLNRDNILEQIKQSTFVRLKLNINVHIYTLLVKIIKMVKAGKFNEAFSFVIRGCKKRLFRIK